ncbi:MAG: hypothetical protein V4611_01665 [Patescibacteria group bacterium]
MYTLKSILKRGSLLGAAGAMLVAAIMPASAAFADALNPLTERSLLLSSSAPGYQDSDGSGNSYENPNPAALGNPGDPGYVPGTYAPAGSGANGRKSGETFTFRVSTDSSVTRDIKAFTLQYCTKAAGLCQAPGDNSGDARTVPGPADRKSNADALADGDDTSDLKIDYTSPVLGVDFDIFVDGVAQTGWVMETANHEDDAFVGALTGSENFVTLKKTTGTGATPVANDQIKLVFYASETNYITNPGSKEFFVKINTYDSHLATDHIPLSPAATNDNIIDGGVTVANVMTDSIHITTKVLETMSFSVGTENPDTIVEADPTDHGTCQAINTPNGNRLQLGNENAEFSLETGQGYDVESFWRLSSNSSGGATVYYSGETLANTVGDVIAPSSAAGEVSQPGKEQFGLAFMAHDAVSASFQTQITAEPLRYHTPSIAPLNKEAVYDDGDGTLDDGDAGAGTARFAFDRASLLTPVAIATNTGVDSQVLTCATAQMRYVANIAADTPAGVYTTKINYLAAPQY